MFVIEPDAAVPRSPRRLVVLTIIGGVLAVALSVVGGIWLVHDLNRTPPLIHKYEVKFDACVRGGGSKSTCNASTLLQCTVDPHWHGAKAAERGCRRWSTVD